MSWLKGLTESLGLTSTGPSSATLQQIKEAPVGTQSLGEQRLSAFEGDLEKAFRPLVRGWQPGQAPLTQEQYDKIQRASIDLFDKLGYLNPMGSQPARVAAASMRKGTRPPPRTYAEAKTPQATEVEFQHASPHKFTNVDVENPLGRFDEAHLLKGEGATVYGPGAAYVSTSEPTHRSYLQAFRGKNITRDSFTPIEQQFGPLPKFLEKELVVRPWTHPSRLEEIIAKQELQIDKSLQQYKTLAADPQNTTQQKDVWKTRIAAKEQELKDLQAADSWLQPIIKTGKSFEDLGLDTRAYSYRGSLAEDPARTVLFDKSLAEQTPEVQAALARASSQARKDIVPEAVESWGQQETRELLRKHFYNKIVEAEHTKFGEIFDRDYAPVLGKKWADFNTAQQGSWLQQLNPNWNTKQRELLEKVELEAARWNKNPKIAARLPGLDEYTRHLLQYRIDVPSKQISQSTDTDKAGEYIKAYRASPKTVQRLRDAGIDLIKYQGSSQSPNYVVVNPAAAKIQSRTPSIAATFGTGELARQLYESIYGKDAQ